MSVLPSSHCTAIDLTVNPETGALHVLVDRKGDDAKREWCRTRLRELRDGNPQAAWEDAEAEWDRDHPYVPSKVEEALHRFQAAVPHPEIHGGKKQKRIWSRMDDEQVDFLDFVIKEGLEHEEGSLFTYLVRCMNTARKLGDVAVQVPLSPRTAFGALLATITALVPTIATAPLAAAATPTTPTAKPMSDTIAEVWAESVLATRSA